MEIIKYVTEQALILIPALYIIGLIIKGTEKIANKYIPLVLLPIGIGGAIALMGLSVDSVVQGVLITGVTVYGNQIVKQIKE